LKLDPHHCRTLLDRMSREHPLAPPAMTASNVADHYDVTMAALLPTGEREVLAWALTHAGDLTPVLDAKAPHDKIEGGYGKAFGHVTVGDKARFLLVRWLGEQLAREAMAQGAAWLDGRPLRWDARAGKFL
jgi:hypothetical protein